MTLSSSLFSSLFVYGTFWICRPSLPFPPAFGSVFELPALSPPEVTIVGLLPVLWCVAASDDGNEVNWWYRCCCCCFGLDFPDLPEPAAMPANPASLSLSLKGRSCWTESGLAKLTIVDPDDLAPDETRESDEVDAAERLDLSCKVRKWYVFYYSLTNTIINHYNYPGKQVC